MMSSGVMSHDHVVSFGRLMPMRRLSSRVSSRKNILTSQHICSLSVVSFAVSWAMNTALVLEHEIRELLTSSFGICELPQSSVEAQKPSGIVPISQPVVYLSKPPAVCCARGLVSIRKECVYLVRCEAQRILCLYLGCQALQH